MLLQELIHVDAPMGAVRDRVLGPDRNGWTTLVKSGGAQGGGRGRLRVGLHGDRSLFAKTFEVELRPPGMRAADIVVEFTASPVGLRLLFPIVRGAIEINPAGASGTQLGEQRPVAPTVSAPASVGTARRTRVLIIEDHRVVAEGLRELIDREADLEVVGVIGSVQEAADLPKDIAVEVVLADYWLPDGNGAEAIAALRKGRGKLEILFLSAIESPAALMSAIQAGARGYVLKSRAASDVVSAIRRVARGEMLIEAATLAKLIEIKGEQSHLYDTLTAREREVLRLMAQGFDNYAVAERLGITYGTTRSHVRNLLAKLEVHSKMEAVVKAEELGLIEPEHVRLPRLE